MNIKTVIIFLIVGIFGFNSVSYALDNKEGLERLCNEEKNGLACLQLGENSRVMDRDNKTALKYFRTGCDNNNMTACVHAGILIQMNGTQYSKQWKEAAALYQKACDQDHDKACFNLGSLKYREGRAKKAIKFYDKACELGNIMACSNAKTLKK